MSMGAWASEKGEVIEMTCRMNDVVVQFYIEEKYKTSWYKLTKESNQTALGFIEEGRRWDHSTSFSIFFNRYKYKYLERYFDVPHFRFGKNRMRKNRSATISDKTIKFSIEPLTGTRAPERVTMITIDRYTGRLDANLMGYVNFYTYGNCLPGLIEWEFDTDPENERKF